MRLTWFAPAISFLIAVLSIPAASAQSLDPAFVKTRAERDAAMQTSNYEVYGRYTTESFWVVMPDGSVQTKQDRISTMKKSQAPPPAQRQKQEQAQGPERRPKGEKINAYGNTVVVSWIAPIEGGKDARFSETWVKQDGTWKCAAAHVSYVQTKP